MEDWKTGRLGGQARPGQGKPETLSVAGRGGGDAGETVVRDTFFLVVTLLDACTSRAAGLDSGRTAQGGRASSSGLCLQQRILGTLRYPESSSTCTLGQPYCPALGHAVWGGRTMSRQAAWEMSLEIENVKSSPVQSRRPCQVREGVYCNLASMVRGPSESIPPEPCPALPKQPEVKCTLDCIGDLLDSPGPRATRGNGMNRCK